MDEILRKSLRVWKGGNCNGSNVSYSIFSPPRTDVNCFICGLRTQRWDESLREFYNIHILDTLSNLSNLKTYNS